MSLSGTLKISVSLTDTKTVGIEAVTSMLNKEYTWTFTDGSGTGIGTADRKWSGLGRALAPSASEDLDLQGALADAWGTVVFARLSAIVFAAASGNTNNVQVTNPASNGVMWTMAAGDGVAIPPGGFVLFVAPGPGFTVTATTADLIHVANSAGGTSVSYDVIVVGKSA